jgi:hypothetical protein
MIRNHIAVLAFAAAACFLTHDRSWAKEISGPQVGDSVTPFNMRGVLDDEAGKNIDLVKDANGRPLVIVFLNEVNRQTVGLARQTLNDAASRKGDGLESGLVLLSADAAQTEEWVKRAVQALPRGVPIGISSDGVDGPPAYGLSRKVAVTVIVAKENRVVANFALVQASVTDDAPKIAEAIAAALGKK